MVARVNRAPVCIPLACATQAPPHAFIIVQCGNHAARRWAALDPSRRPMLVWLAIGNDDQGIVPSRVRIKSCSSSCVHIRSFLHRSEQPMRHVDAV